MTEQTKLFDGTYIKTALKRATRDALQAVEDWDPNKLLVTHEDDLVDRVVAKHSMTCPVLRRKWIKQMPVVEHVEQVQRIFGGVEVIRKIQITIAVPFHGTRRVFELNPSRLVSGEIYGEIDHSEIRLTWTGSVDSRQHDQQRIRQYFDTRIDMIEQRLGKCQTLLDQHRSDLRVLVKDKVSKRRATPAAHRSGHVNLGFPIRQRRDSSRFSNPEKRHTIETVSVAAPARVRCLTSSDATAGYELLVGDADYEAALRVLVNARNALERTPSMTAILDENKIRDVLLVSLNAWFEGKAAGEVSNGAGKTDILIRKDDRNILIAECKIWRGPKTIREALDQLLGYLVWRDTKAALLLFIRGDNVTEAIGRAVREIKQHPNCKCMHGTPRQHERYDFVFSANDDHNQDIRLTFLPFALQDRTSRRAWVNEERR